MVNCKTITSLSLLTLLSLATFSAKQDSKVLAQDSHSSATISNKPLKKQLALADKEAEPIYQEMARLQRKIEKIKAQHFTPTATAISQEIERLNEHHASLLESFYQEIGDQSWSSKEEALSLVAQSNLTSSEKEALKAYFDQNEELQKILKEKTLRYDQETASYNAQLAILTQKTDKIYEKHGITKDSLATYYAQTGMRAD